VKRNYTYEIDRPVQKANQAIVASIPMKYKQGIKEHLRPLGFTGFKLDELTPNKTRRAQCVNWMLYYREALRGKTIEQVMKRDCQSCPHFLYANVADTLGIYFAS
jgi:hypothetical protein